MHQISSQVDSAFRLSLETGTVSFFTDESGLNFAVITEQIDKQPMIGLQGFVKVSSRSQLETELFSDLEYLVCLEEDSNKLFLMKMVKGKCKECTELPMDAPHYEALKARCSPPKVTYEGHLPKFEVNCTYDEQCFAQILAAQGLTPYNYVRRYQRVNAEEGTIPSREDFVRRPIPLKGDPQQIALPAVTTILSGQTFVCPTHKLGFERSPLLQPKKGSNKRSIRPYVNNLREFYGVTIAPPFPFLGTLEKWLVQNEKRKECKIGLRIVAGVLIVLGGAALVCATLAIAGVIALSGVAIGCLAGFAVAAAALATVGLYKAGKSPSTPAVKPVPVPENTLKVDPKEEETVRPIAAAAA